MNWRNIYKGMMIGICDLVPGVSGGTVALLLGIYDEIVAAINGVISRHWRKHVLFLIPIGLGMLFSLFVFSRGIKWLLDHHAQPTFFCFLGLIVGIVPFLLNTIDYKRTFKGYHYIILIVMGLLLSLLSFLPQGGQDVISNLTVGQYIFLFFAGWLASSALILPGISGTFVLLLLGVYYTVIDALKNLDFTIIAVVGCGVVVGLILTSKIVNFILINYTVGTYAAVIGLVLGSGFVIFPGMPQGVLTFIICLASFAGGLAFTYYLGRIEKVKRV